VSDKCCCVIRIWIQDHVTSARGNRIHK